MRAASTDHGESWDGRVRAGTGDAGRGVSAQLRLYGNPLRQAISATSWRAAWYLLAYQLVGWALFAAAVTAASTAAVLAITLAGIPLLLAAARVIRGCADAERGRLGAVLGGSIEGRYREAAGAGVTARARRCWTDPATWRDVAYVIGMFVPLAALGLVVLAIWLTFAAGITVPLWYWAPFQRYPHGVTVHGVQLGYFPHGPSGAGAVGLYVDTMPKALLTCAACLVLFALFSYAVVLTARMHAAVALALLRPAASPHQRRRDSPADGAAPRPAAHISCSQASSRPHDGGTTR